jgi:agmatine deiminase
MDCMAAQRGGLAGQVSAHPLGVCGDCAPSVARRGRQYPGQRSGSGAPRAEPAEAGRREYGESRSHTRSGPIFVKNSENSLAITNWKFNAWAKYDNWRRDDQIPQRVAELYDMPEIKPEIDGQRLVLEGGSIDTNGAGILLTTEECLLSEVQQRNPGVGREQLETAFQKYLGIDQVVWLHRGCAGDDTHGHVDDITRFVDENLILTAVEKNTGDENHLPLAENLDRLRSARNLAGKPFEVRELPMPDPVVFGGQRLPASYANFYIANDLVLVPTFNDCHDRHALNIIADCFPSREVIGIHCVDFIWGLGALHCMTQQEPA